MAAGLIGASIPARPASSWALAAGFIPEPSSGSTVAVLRLTLPAVVPAPRYGQQEASVGLPVPQAATGMVGAVMAEFGRSAVAMLRLTVKERESARVSGHQAARMTRVVPKTAHGIVRATMTSFTPHTYRPHFG
jgi:hypothetical protein